MQPILKVDLSTSKTETCTIPEAWERDFLGGASMAARLLFEDLSAKPRPLSPEAPLLFINGPLTGTSGPAVGRFVVAARSPATGLWGESNCGGFWGPELRKAGFDGLWITGQATEPVTLWIQDREVEIRPAGHLWGMDTYATQEALQQKMDSGRPRVAVIGPAGEAGIPYALILADHGRVAGRTGMGAVMGSKRLKAVVVEGHSQVPVADPKGYLPLRSEANRVLRNDPISLMLRQLGTAGAIEYFDYLQELPKRYFQDQYFDGAKRISGCEITDKYLAGVTACHACLIACGRIVRLDGGEKHKGAEYETLAGYGPNLLIDDPAFATRMGGLCDRYGMDSISLSNTIGLAFMLYELGILTSADTGGMALAWGDQDVVEACVHKTASGQGFGVLLSRGARSLAKHCGVEPKAVQVNGLEVAYHDPRGATGMALVYATSPRGACHNQSDYFNVEIGQIEESLGLEYFSRHAGVEKARNVAIHQNWRTLLNSLVLCIFANLEPQTIMALVNSACRFSSGIKDLQQTGERAWNLKRIINSRLGLSRSSDRIPEAFLRPFSDGRESANQPVTEFEAMLEAYYSARGWNPGTGLPTPEKLEQLGLEWAFDG